MLGNPRMFARLLLLFILVPIAELALFITLGEKLGLLNTLAVIVATGVLGAALTKSQGFRAIQRFQAAMAEGRVPHHEIVDGLLILLAGAVLLTPGFLTDTVGFLLLVPPARAVVRKYLAARVSAKISVTVRGTGPATPSQAPRTAKGRVIDVEGGE
jgi:UPF0716 protein FxsA